MIKILLAEDHLVVRNGIKLLLDTQENISVIGEADNGVQVLDIIQSGNVPDIILTDINMDEINGIELLKRLSYEYPSIRIIILSMLNTSPYVLEAFNKGAKGYLVKNVSYEELLFGINHVYRGGRYLCEELAMLLIENFNEQPIINNQAEQFIKDFDISDRELEILQLISDGLTNVEIAEKLFLSKRTVEGHRQNLIDKAGVKNSASLIKLAVKNGIVK